eukprot:7168059-Heterocapsa_arctica.AAC.1
MSDDQMRHIIRWIKTLKDTDPMMQGLVKDEEILYKEEAKHGMVEINGHKQLQEALMAMGMAGE